METVTLPQTGGCLCGAVRLRLSGAPLLAYACHCHDCQTRSGAAFTLNLVVNSADLACDGPLETLTRATRSGRVVEQAYCRHCRIHLASRAPVAPAFASLRAGVLDDASWVKPIAQSFVESALPWEIIPDVRNVPWSEFDYEALGREWTATAPRFAPGS